MGEEGSHETRHEGSSASQGHEGDEEEGSDEARHEGSCTSQGHEGDEEEGSDEARHEGSSASSTKESHEGHEVSVITTFAQVVGMSMSVERCIVCLERYG